MDRPDDYPTTGVARAPMPFTQIGRYRLVRLIGRGGMGMVFHALHTDLHQPVALKLIRDFDRFDTDQIERFRREIRAIGTLLHPNIVRATDAGEEDGTLFLVMELLEGTTLEDLVRQRGPVPVADACELIRQTALGLQAIHVKGRVHRDIKPQNLMLVHDPQRNEYLVKILDLGLALFKEGDAGGATDSRHIIGTFDYISPEQARRSHEVDIRADIYSLGCTFYKLLTGEAPYPSPRYKTFSEKLDAHELKPLPLLPAFVPEAVQAIVQKMTVKQPTLRYQTPLEVAEALAMHARAGHIQALLPSGSDALEPSPKPSTRPDRQGTTDHPETPVVMASTIAVLQPRPRRWLLVVLSLGLCGFLASLPWMLVPWREPTDPPKPGPKEPAPVVQDPLPLVKAPLPIADVLTRIEATDRSKARDYTTAAPEVAHDLLADSPIVILGISKEKKDLTRELWFNPREKQIKVAGGTDALVTLGKVHAPSYALTFTVNQHPPIKGVGIFFGFVDDRSNPSLPGASWQHLTIGHVRKNDQINFLASRGKCDVEWPREGEPRLVIGHDEREPIAAVVGPLTLEVEVADMKVKDIRLNGKTLSRLTYSRSPTLLRRSTAGYFGIHHAGTQATYMNAQIRVTKIP